MTATTPPPPARRSSFAHALQRERIQSGGALSQATAVRAAAVAARRSKEMGAAWRDWLDRQVAPAFGDRILPVDAAVIRRRMQIPYTDDNEGILAATALVHNLTLVTNEPSKYRAGRVKVLGPSGLEIDGTDDADWREATHSGATWFRNLLVR